MQKQLKGRITSYRQLPQHLPKGQPACQLQERNCEIPAFTNPVRSFGRNRADGGSPACGRLQWFLSPKAIVLSATMNTTSDTKCLNDVWPLSACREFADNSQSIFTSDSTYYVLLILPILCIADSFSSIYKGTSSRMRFNMISPLICFYSLLQLHAAFSLPSIPLNSPPLSLVSNPVAFNLSKPT